MLVPFELLDIMPGWDAAESDPEDDWPEDIGVENSSWVEPAYDVIAWEWHDVLERDDPAPAPPSYEPLVICGTCRPWLVDNIRTIG